MPPLVPIPPQNPCSVEGGKWCGARGAALAMGNNLFRQRVGVLSRHPSPSARPIDTNPKQELRAAGGAH
ncbi:MAG: hypothetical protein ACI4QD_08810 [Kiritimatiellia bacterium]